VLSVVISSKSGTNIRNLGRLVIHDSPAIPGTRPLTLVYPRPGSQTGKILADDPSFTILDEIHKHLDFCEFSTEWLEILVYILFLYSGF